MERTKQKNHKTEVGRHLSLLLIIDGKLHGPWPSAEIERRTMLAWTSVLGSHQLGIPCLRILRASHRSMIFVPAIRGLDDVDFPRRRGLLSWPGRCGIGNSQADAGDRFFTPRSIRKLSGILDYYFCFVGTAQRSCNIHSIWTEPSLETNHLPGHPHGQI